MGQFAVDVLGQDTVRGTVAGLGIRLFITDKDIIAFFFAGNFDDLLTDALQELGFLTIQGGGHIVSTLHSLLVIGVIQYAVKGGTVTGGYLAAGGGIVHVFDTVFTQNQTPVGFSLLGKFRNDGLINGSGLVKITRCS